MSKPQNATKYSKAYHRTAVRHRGYGRRRLFLVRPRPPTFAEMWYYDSSDAPHMAGTAILLRGTYWLFFHEGVKTTFNDIKNASDPWKEFNTQKWFYPIPDATDWVNPGFLGSTWHMAGPPPTQTIQDYFSWG